MTSPRKAAWAALLTLASLLLVAGCGGGTDRTKAQVRLVNASLGYAQLDLRVDSQLSQGGVAYGGSAGYVEVDPDDPATTVSSAGSATALLSFTPALSAKKYTSVLAYGAAGALRHVVLDDNTAAPDAGKALLRVLNAAPDAGSLDVYLTGTDDILLAAVPVQAAAMYGTLGGWVTVNSANWRLRVTAAGSKTDVRLDVPLLALPSRHVTTLVLTPGARDAGGVLVGSLAVAQQGAITREDARHARVRLAAVVAASATVAATVGTTTLAAGVGSPALADYVLLPTGVSAVTVAVNGTAVAAPAKTLDAGRDYTLMVHGLAAAGRVSWIEDDNRLPSDSARAKLRLVNGLAETAATLSMTLDFSPVADGVAIGAASAYASVAPTSGGGTDGALSITAAGGSSPVFTAVDQILRANATYSVFLVGPPSARVGIVRKDR
jgi:Domain of unknown function (DUF4397)